MYLESYLNFKILNELLISINYLKCNNRMSDEASYKTIFCKFTIILTKREVMMEINIELSPTFRLLDAKKWKKDLRKICRNSILI